MKISGRVAMTRITHAKNFSCQNVPAARACVKSAEPHTKKVGDPHIKIMLMAGKIFRNAVPAQNVIATLLSAKNCRMIHTSAATVVGTRASLAVAVTIV